MGFNPLVAAATGFGATLILGAIVFAAAFLGAALVAGFAAFFWTGLALAFTVLVLGASTFAGVGAAASATAGAAGVAGLAAGSSVAASKRSEEQTSELQSLMRTTYAVFCLK